MRSTPSKRAQPASCKRQAFSKKTSTMCVVTITFGKHASQEEQGGWGERVHSDALLRTGGLGNKVVGMGRGRQRVTVALTGTRRIITAMPARTQGPRQSISSVVYPVICSTCQHHVNAGTVGERSTWRARKCQEAESNTLAPREQSKRSGDYYRRHRTPRTRRGLRRLTQPYASQIEYAQCKPSLAQTWRC